MKFVKPFRKIRPVNSGKLSIVAIKKVTKALENMGKSVTSIRLDPNGAVHLTTSDGTSGTGESSANPWDEVLPS